MKTLLEVIKLNKSNINDIKIPHKFEAPTYKIGDIEEYDGEEYVYAGKTENGENMFVRELTKTYLWASDDYYNGLKSVPIKNKDNGFEQTDMIMTYYHESIADSMWEEIKMGNHGIIDYIPSVEELQTILKNKDKLQLENGTFWSSTCVKSDSWKAYAIDSKGKEIDSLRTMECGVIVVLALKNIENN